MVIMWLMMVNNNLVGGFNLPSKMMDFVSWDDDIPNYYAKSYVPNYYAKS